MCTLRNAIATVLALAAASVVATTPALAQPSNPGEAPPPQAPFGPLAAPAGSAAAHNAMPQSPYGPAPASARAGAVDSEEPPSQTQNVPIDPPNGAPTDAPDSAPANESPVRHVLVAGLGLGAGEVVQAGQANRGGIAITYRFGGLISPWLAVMLDGDEVISDLSIDHTIQQGMAGVAVQVWPVRSIRFRGTVGVGREQEIIVTHAVTCRNGLFGRVCDDKISTDTQSTSFVPAAALTAGFELVQIGHVVFSAELRASRYLYDDGATNSVVVAVAADYLGHR